MTRQVLRFGAAVMTTLLALLLLWEFRIVVVYLLVSLALAAAFRPFARHWARQGRALRVALILLYVVGLGGIAVVVFLVGRSLIGEVQQMASVASSQGEWTVPQWLEGSSFQQALIARLPTPDRLFQAVTGDQGERVLPALLGFSQGLGGVVSGVVVVLFLSLYWASNQVHFERLWLSLLPPGQRGRVRDVWRTIELGIGAYLRGQIGQSVIAAVLLGLGYWALGSPYPLLLALFGAAASLIPLVGGPLAVLPPLLVGLLSDAQTSLLTALYALVVMTAIWLWVKPRLVNRTWENPILTVVLLMALADALGLLGIILAPPLSVACQILWSNVVTRRAVPGAATRLSDLQERQAAAWQNAMAMQGPMPRLVTSSMRRLTGLLGKSEFVLRTAPVGAAPEPGQPLARVNEGPPVAAKR